jgi:leucyl/phenylalanyl-tRNA--protein transferase
MQSMPEMPPRKFFPPAECANPDGLVALGGRLAPEWLLDAYQHGIFPWPFCDDDEGPMAWWSPDPRAVIELEGLHVSRRLKRTCRSGRFQLTCDRDFAGVIQGCATAEGRVGHTWITPHMIAAYTRMFELGHAHSVEVWCEGRLAGGLYGLAIGGLFAAESKFHDVRDASKVALVHLVNHLRTRGYLLLDIQQLTPHTARLGATAIPRAEYLDRLAHALAVEVSFGDRLESETGRP